MHHDLSKGETPQGAITLGVSLVEKGIPVQVYALESFKDKEALKEIKTLVLSYDFMKPEDVQYNQAIADWVKDGGSLLYIGAKNEYTSIPALGGTRKGMLRPKNNCSICWASPWRAMAKRKPPPS